jgi:hydroxymethylpyrimidine kinase/phosphomethylpyrimidine kinase/thiamine-phosphate diphosphorylase
MQASVIWTIGGLDPSTGAGISRDLAVFQNLDQQGYSLCTAVTAQNHLGVSRVQPVDADLLNEQLKALAALSTPAVIKISMLTADRQAEVLLPWLQRLKKLNPDLFVLYDPVLVAGAGGQLSSLSRDAIIQLVSACDLLCPNYDEAKTLSAGSNDAIELIRELATQLDVPAILLKGGHSAGEEVEDLLWQKHKARPFSVRSMRLAVGKTHGTGCTFAAALSVFIAQHFELDDAVYLAKCYITAALELAGNIVQSPAVPEWKNLGLPGWPVQQSLSFSLGDEIFSSTPDEVGFPAVDNDKFHFYPVLDTLEWVEWALNHGVKTVQLRLKNISDKASLRMQIRKAVALGRAHNAQLFINDYWQLAIEEGAYGVHLGQEDLITANIQAIANAGLRLGLSTHSLIEIERAMKVKPSYIALGHIFPTKTKDMPSQPQGLKKLRFYQQWIGDKYPTVAIGGISQSRAPGVLAQGVSCIAVVTALTEAEHPFDALNNFYGVVNEYFY